MEEWIGELWHKMITRMADKRYPHAAVRLVQMHTTLGIFFRALGGDGGLLIEAADATENRSQRSWVQKLAGTNTKTHLAWRDERALRLPPAIAWFDSTELNRDMYFWLAALGACADATSHSNADWFNHNQSLTRRVLQLYPGLTPRYQRLVRQHLEQRPDPAALNGMCAEAESAIRQALTDPGSVPELPLSKRPLQTVPLWLHPDPPGSGTAEASHDNVCAQQHSEDMRELDDVGHLAATDRIEAGHGLVEHHQLGSTDESLG